MKTTNKIKTIVLALAGAGFVAFPYCAFANPTGGQVVAGSATIRQETASKVGITQATDKAIIDWQKFSIGTNEQVQFYQPSASSVSLNRVVGQDPSQILGRLTANGQVFLVNPNGIYFGKNAQIDVAGLVASTHNIRNEDFLAEKYLFNIPGKSGAAVINEGSIRIADTGIAAFVAPSVANRGVIVAKLGKVALAAANGFTLDFHGDELLTFLVSDEVAKTAFDLDGKQLTSFVENSGKIEAQGGYVLLTAKAAENAIHGVINQSGVIEATSVDRQNGEIVLAGGQHGVVSNTGTLDASGKDAGETGGKVQITGEKIGLFSGTLIDVSGDQGGGKAIIGGDYLGGKASDALMAELGIQREAKAIQTAAYTNMASDAVINADAISKGKGGKVVLWSDNRTLAYGAISAKGGSQRGDGGFVEVSGEKQLDIAGFNVDASSKSGKAGTVLYDPGDVYITDDSQAVASYNVSNFTSTTPAYWGSRTNIGASNIEAALNNGTNVVIRGNPGTPGNDGSGQIYIEKSIRKTRGGDAMLSLFAADQIVLYSGREITSTSGKLDIYMDADYDRYSYGLIDLQAGSVIKTNGGFVNLNGSNIFQNGLIDTTGRDGSSGQVRQAHDYFQTVDFSSLRAKSGEGQNNSNNGQTNIDFSKLNGEDLFLQLLVNENIKPDPSNTIWSGLYVGGKATEAQKEANRLFNSLKTEEGINGLSDSVVSKVLGAINDPDLAKSILIARLYGKGLSVKIVASIKDGELRKLAEFMQANQDKLISISEQKGSGSYMGTDFLNKYFQFNSYLKTNNFGWGKSEKQGEHTVKLVKLGEMEVLGVKLIAANSVTSEGKIEYGNWPTQCVNLPKGLISGLTGKESISLGNGSSAYASVENYFTDSEKFKVTTYKANGTFSDAPLAGSVISFSATKSNSYGHVALIDSVSTETKKVNGKDVEVLKIKLFEQNEPAMHTVSLEKNDKGEWVNSSGNGLGEITGWAAISNK